MIWGWYQTDLSVHHQSFYYLHIDLHTDTHDMTVINIIYSYSSFEEGRETTWGEFMRIGLELDFE